MPHTSQLFPITSIPGVPHLQPQPGPSPAAGHFPESQASCSGLGLSLPSQMGFALPGKGAGSGGALMGWELEQGQPFPAEAAWWEPLGFNKPIKQGTASQ